MNELRAIVRGRVQLVMFRDFTKRRANKLGLVGYVANLPDKTVEVVAQGEQQQLESLLVELRKGSILSRVSDISVEWRESGERYSDFFIAY